MGNMSHIVTLENFGSNMSGMGPISNPQHIDSADPDLEKTTGSKVYLYFVNNESEEDFDADIRDPDGKVVFTFGKEMFEDGIMQHKDDLGGLKRHLAEKKKIGQNDDIAPGDKTSLSPTGGFNQMTPEFNTNESEMVSIKSFQDFQDQSAKSAEEVPGGKSSGMEPEDIADLHNVSLDFVIAQLDKGQKIEMEHTDDPAKAREIAMDHLEEMPDYYDRLSAIEPENEE